MWDKERTITENDHTQINKSLYMYKEQSQTNNKQTKAQNQGQSLTKLNRLKVSQRDEAFKF